MITDRLPRNVSRPHSLRDDLLEDLRAAAPVPAEEPSAPAPPSPPPPPPSASAPAAPVLSLAAPPAAPSSAPAPPAVPPCVAGPSAPASPSGSAAMEVRLTPWHWVFPRTDIAPDLTSVVFRFGPVQIRFGFL